MSIEISIHDGPLSPEPHPLCAGKSEAGAVLRFEGVVRGRDGERLIAALGYESYEPMASDQLRALSEEISAKHGLLAMRVRHSRGRVAVGECSFRLEIAAKHRKECLAAMDEFIDRMKRDVPIWKRPEWTC